jgi:hypothetical protein
MQAIVTKYIGPSNTKGARIQARMGDVRVSVPYPHELSGAAGHFEAVKALCEKLGYKDREFVSAFSNDGYVFIMTNYADKFSV